MLQLLENIKNTSSKCLIDSDPVKRGARGSQRQTSAFHSASAGYKSGGSKLKGERRKWLPFAILGTGLPHPPQTEAKKSLPPLPRMLGGRLYSLSLCPASSPKMLTETTQGLVYGKVPISPGLRGQTWPCFELSSK